MCAQLKGTIMAIKFDSFEHLAKTMNKPVDAVKKRIKQDTGVVTDKHQIRPADKLKEFINAPLNYELLPPALPQVILFRALVPHFGLYSNKGDLVYELKDVIPGRKFEVDIALPRYKVAIEMDGWESHGKYLAGFKRDREKWLLFATEGWLVLPISREQIIDELENTISMILTCAQRRAKVDVDLIDKKQIVGAIYRGDL